MTEALRGAIVAAMKEVPYETVLAIARRLSATPTLHDGVSNTIACIPASPHARHIIGSLIAAWKMEMGEHSARLLAAVLETNAHTHAAISDSLRVESVWSGPSDIPILDRKSMQAMFDVINGARKELLLASYVIHDIESTVERLRAASDRGVRIIMIVEMDKQHGGTLDYSGIAKAGLPVIPHLELFYWPLERRHIVDGKSGILHAKCIVADRRDALVSSANLTEHAFHRNIELGVRITGGTVPESIVRQFEELIRTHVLISVEREE